QPAHRNAKRSPAASKGISGARPPPSAPQRSIARSLMVPPPAAADLSPPEKAGGSSRAQFPDRCRGAPLSRQTASRRCSVPPFGPPPFPARITRPAPLCQFGTATAPRNAGNFCEGWVKEAFVFNFFKIVCYTGLEMQNKKSNFQVWLSFFALGEYTKHTMQSKCGGFYVSIYRLSLLGLRQAPDRYGRYCRMPRLRRALSPRLLRKAGRLCL